jgi:hypothetical protein
MFAIVQKWRVQDDRDGVVFLAIDSQKKRVAFLKMHLPELTEHGRKFRNPKVIFREQVIGLMILRRQSSLKAVVARAGPAVEGFRQTF